MAKIQKTKNKKKPNFRVIATTILLLATALFSYSACRFLDEVKSIKEYNERAIEESNNATFSAISGLINSICISAEDSLQDNLKIAGSTLSRDDKEIARQTLNGDDSAAFESKEISNIFFKDYYFLAFLFFLINVITLTARTVYATTINPFIILSPVGGVITCVESDFTLL